jgi:hypothetical protein
MATEVLGKINARTTFWARNSKLLDKNSMRVLALIQFQFDYSITSWFGGISILLKGKLQIAQNKLIRVVLSPCAHIGRSCFQEFN